MANLENPVFIEKASMLKRPLKHTQRKPVTEVKIEKKENGFQQLAAVPVSACEQPMVLNAGESRILDFGDHSVGYLHFSVNHLLTARIADSPVVLRFSFGEFPLEIVADPAAYKGTLGRGWLQNEVKSVVFAPYCGQLERRYAFRYLKIERIDNAAFPISISNLYVDAVSAVSMDDAACFTTGDALLDKIYEMSLKTLKECEQDVFEDGPKRDRRLWIGDLRLQAMADRLTFQNVDLFKRCMYLFAGYRTPNGLVAPCAFPDSPPCVDGWVFIDYSLFFISCLYDYVMDTRDIPFLNELYPIAEEQAQKTLAYFNYETGELTGVPAHIEWCRDLDKGLAAACVLVYALKQLAALMEILDKDTSDIRKTIAAVSDSILRNHTRENGLFKTQNGQISWSSQIWLVLAELLSKEENARLLQALEAEQPGYGIHTPYLMHYYLDALFRSGLEERAMQILRDFWGQLVDFGFDCCPEIFNPVDHFESPYSAAEVNSACHAWSCTPIYWLQKYYQA